MIKKFLFYRIKSPFVTILFLFVFGTGLLLGRISFEEKKYSYNNYDFTLFWEALDLIEKKYVYSDSIDYKKLVEGAISGMVNSLDDYPTTFFNKEEAKRFLEDTNGNFEGVGMEIGLRNGQLQVVTPLENTPAKKAGLRAGDNIIEIDKKFTNDITAEEAVSLIRGDKGTVVNLLIFREGWDKPREFSIIRDVIEIPSMSFELIEEGRIAYIKLYHFSSKSGSDFSKIGKEILNSSSNSIILDLRNNPGGYLNEAKDIAGWFLKEGNIVTIQEGKDDRREYKADVNGQLSYYPITILINGGSASASEILASAIKENLENDKVILIGEKSFGKGSVQELVKLKDGSSIKITVAKWLTPKGNLIDKVGITPDILVELSESDYETGNDPQLLKAIEILKNIR